MILKAWSKIAISLTSLMWSIDFEQNNIKGISHCAKDTHIDEPKKSNWVLCGVKFAIVIAHILVKKNKFLCTRMTSTYTKLVAIS